MHNKIVTPIKKLKLGEIIRQRTRTKGFQNDETLPNFIKTKHPTKGKTRNKRK